MEKLDFHFQLDSPPPGLEMKTLNLREMVYPSPHENKFLVEYLDFKFELDSLPLLKWKLWKVLMKHVDFHFQLVSLTRPHPRKSLKLSQVVHTSPLENFYWGTYISAFSWELVLNIYQN